MKKNSQFILLKIPPHLVSLLGKIHALSIEVLSAYHRCNMKQALSLAGNPSRAGPYSTIEAKQALSPGMDWVHIRQ